MTIIICGPNGSGKSTLASQLSNVLGWEVVHSIKPSDIADSVSRNNIELSKVINGERLILDRVQCISDPIYNNSSVEYYKQAAKIISSLGTLIYCTGKGEMDFTDKIHYDEELTKQCIDEADIIRRAYEVTMNDLQHIKYNFEEKNAFEKLIENSCLQLIINMI